MKQSARHLIYILALLMTTLGLLSSCCSDDEDEILPTKTPPGYPGQKLSRTLIVYMGGENSLTNFVGSDSLEIARGLASLGDGARVVVFIDDSKSSRLCVGTRTEPLEQVKAYNRNICSTYEADMEYVLSDIQNQYPAEHYGLVLWSHASGWVFANSSEANKAPRRSFGIDNGKRSDEDSGPRMDVTTLSRVLSHFPHCDYLFFDACFMQCIEVAYELRECADYIIGSPAEIPGPGAPYDRLLAPLCQVPADVEGVVRKYSEYYESGKGGSPYYGVELSLIKTDALEDLADVTMPCYLKILSADEEPYCTSVQKYCFAPGTRYTEFYDLKNWMYQLLSPEDYAVWDEAYKKAVPLTALSKQWFSTVGGQAQRYVADAEHCGGVSAFIPSSEYAEKGWVENYHQLSWYEDAGISLTGW